MHDCTFRAHKIKKEHCHSGKHNDVNCIKMMKKADELFHEFSESIRQKKIPTKDDAMINAKCQQFATEAC